MKQFTNHESYNSYVVSSIDDKTSTIHLTFFSSFAGSKDPSEKHRMYEVSVSPEELEQLIDYLKIEFYSARENNWTNQLISATSKDAQAAQIVAQQLS